VLVSNRGHQSIAILKIKERGANKGQLSTVGYFHTRGETPRHFKFDSSGQYLLVANQDSDNLSIFNFNQSSGEIKFTGNDYRVPSPNFVCCCTLHDDDTEYSNNSTSSSTASDISEPISEENSSIVCVDSSKKKLEDALAKAMAEVERLRSTIAAFDA